MQQRIRRRVIKGGVKAVRRQKLDATDLARIEHIRVQVMSPVIRLVLAITGLGLCVVPFAGLISIWWMLVCLPVGLFLLLVAINGRKKEVGDAIAEVGGEFAGELLKEVIAGIASGL